MTADEALRQSVNREIVHGEQALTPARALRDLGMYNDALSRLYYAVFHFAAALLLTAFDATAAVVEDALQPSA